MSDIRYLLLLRFLSILQGAACDRYSVEKPSFSLYALWMSAFTTSSTYLNILGPEHLLPDAWP